MQAQRIRVPSVSPISMTIFQRQDKTSFSFTADRLTKLTPPLSGEATYHDTGVDGLCIRVRPSGAAAYIVRYRLPGSPRSRRITLGAIDVMSIAEARTRAREAILSARKGVDPLEERKAAARSLSEARYAVTVAQLIDEHERAQRSAGICIGDNRGQIDEGRTQECSRPASE